MTNYHSVYVGKRSDCQRPRQAAKTPADGTGRQFFDADGHQLAAQIRPPFAWQKSNRAPVYRGPIVEGDARMREFLRQVFRCDRLLLAEASAGVPVNAVVVLLTDLGLLACMSPG